MQIVTMVVRNFVYGRLWLWWPVHSKNKEGVQKNIHSLSQADLSLVQSHLEKCFKPRISFHYWGTLCAISMACDACLGVGNKFCDSLILIWFKFLIFLVHFLSGMYCERKAKCTKRGKDFFIVVRGFLYLEFQASECYLEKWFIHFTCLVDKWIQFEILSLNICNISLTKCSISLNSIARRMLLCQVNPTIYTMLNLGPISQMIISMG